MEFGLLTELAPGTLLASFAIAACAGLVKGAVGFALPLVMVSGLSSIMDPKFAIAGILFSVVATNAVQSLRQGLQPAKEAVALHWRYITMVCLAIMVFTQVAARLPSQVFYFALGVPVVVLSAIQLLGVRLTIAPHHRTRAEWVVGALSGAIGGLVGTWGPTTVLYLLAIETPKVRQIAVQGVIYGLGSVVLFLGHLQSGMLNAKTAPFSAALLPVALIGLWVGFRIQDRMDQARFTRLTLIVLIVAGLNLLRKGLFG